MRPSRIALQVAHVLTLVLGLAAIVSALLLIRIAPERRTDFAIFYRSALAWRQGGTIYPTERVNLNPPAIVVAYAPLTYVSRQTAHTTFTLFGIACVLAACWRIARVIPRVPWLVLASIVLALDGGWTNLWLGQEGLILMWIVTAAWLADRDDRDLSAGAWAGVAIYAKPFLVGLIVYWAWRRKWPRIGSALVSGAIMTLLGVALAGSASYRAWWNSLSLGPAPYAPLNGSLLGLWSRTFFGSEFAPPLFHQPLGVLLTVWGLSLIALVWAICRRIAAEQDINRAWALVLIGSLLASPLGWIYYLPIVVGPVVACLGGFTSWVCVWVSVAILLIVRSEVLVQLHTSAIGAIVLGSIHCWVLLLLFMAALKGSPDAGVTLGESNDRDRASDPRSWKAKESVVA
jgi:alpha-1,2-mannosyltransferase